MKKAGIRPETGLFFCQGDEELYHSLLREYAQNASGKASDMERFYKEQNWKDYAILVHALKSTSRMIGAEQLSGLAAALEDAANRNDVVTITGSHADLMRQYDAAAGAVRSSLKEEEGESSPEEDILEFFPE